MNVSIEQVRIKYIHLACHRDVDILSEVIGRNASVVKVNSSFKLMKQRYQMTCFIN